MAERAPVARISCALTSRAADEPRYGTASQVRRWILLEQPGPWGKDALAESRLPPGMGQAFTEIGRRTRARVLLIRRHGRYSPSHRSCFVAVSEPGGCMLEEFAVDDLDELVDLPWERLAGSQPVGGRPLDQPLYLVCTNGAHDACCAEYGRPLAALLSASHAPQVWECSHFGGDRFAANLVCLPEGIYYGRIGLEAGPRIVREHEAGRVELDHWRGRSSSPFAAQAAEYFLRARNQLTGIDDVRLQAHDVVDDGLHRVRLATPDHAWLVTVAEEPAAPARLTCRAGSAVAAPRYQLIKIAPAVR